MARVVNVAVVAGGGYANPNVSKAITFVAADATNKQSVLLTGKEMLIAYNSGVSTRTVTVTTTVDDKGRTGDLGPENIAAGAYRVYGPFQTPGYIQSDGYLYFEASHADVGFAVVRLP